jgi:TetR/AcrR family transcriptional regulator, transcriptional repressor for nem operon
MPRPRLFDTERLVEKLCDYFWEHGYARTSLDDLAKLLGVKRGSLFHAFGDKDALITLAYEHYADTYLRPIEISLRGLDSLGLESIARHFEGEVELATTKGIGRGCFLMNLLLEANFPPSPSLRQAVDQDVAFIKRFFANNLRVAQSAGALRATVPIPDRVEALFGVNIGIFILARIRVPDSAIQEFVNNNLRGLTA